MVVSISSIDTIDLFSAILSAVGGGAIVADSRLGLSLSKITFRFIPTASLKRAYIIPLIMDGT